MFDAWLFDRIFIITFNCCGVLKILIEMSVDVLGISGRRNCLRTCSWNKLVINGISWKRKKIETILFRIIIPENWVRMSLIHFPLYHICTTFRIGLIQNMLYRILEHILYERTFIFVIAIFILIL